MKIDKNYFLLYYDSFMTYLSLFHAQTIIFILKQFLCWKEGTGSVYKRWFGFGTGSLSQRRSLKKEFRMHYCYAFEMYIKDGPLRRSSECIAMHLKCISKTVP